MENSTRDPDRQLVDDCLSGSESAWTEFHSRFIGLIRNVVRRQSRLSASDIDDVTQSAFLSLTTALAGYDERRSLASFVCLVAERVLIDEFRRIKAAKRDAELQAVDHHDSSKNGSIMIESKTESPETQVQKYELTVILSRALESLDTACKELLKLRFYKELSFAEIGKLLGVAENTLMVRTRRCLERLRHHTKVFSGEEQSIE